MWVTTQEYLKRWKQSEARSSPGANQKHNLKHGLIGGDFAYPEGSTVLSRPWRAEIVKPGPPFLSRFELVCCSSAAIGVEPVETMDCVESFPSILLTVWTRNYCVEVVESKALD